MRKTLQGMKRDMRDGRCWDMRKRLEEAFFACCNSLYPVYAYRNYARIHETTIHEYHKKEEQE